ncbi:MAG TPA: ABC transporter permease [Gemmatimonadales bacterium]|nr:ABC transporter permease [Gemmatimonadales bacterium]
MSLRRTFAITGRLLRQFRHDHRTLGILFVTPLLVLALFAVLFRADAPTPSVGVLADPGGMPRAVAAALRDSDLIDVVQSCTNGASCGLQQNPRDARIFIPNPDGDRVVRPEVRFLNGDQQMAAIVARALRESLAAVAASANPNLPRVEPVIDHFYGGEEELDSLDLLGGPFIGLLVFFLVYVVTSVSFLRERSLGTLERLMASPLRRLEIVVGYMLGFTVVALIQAAEVLGFGLLVLDLYNAGPVWLIFLIEVLLALGAVNLGIFLSTFARNEFQAVQFIPLVVVPQVLLSGLLVQVSSEPEWLQWISNALPLTYAVDGLREVMLRGADLSSQRVQLDVGVLAAFCVVAIVAAAATLRREVA